MKKRAPKRNLVSRAEVRKLLRRISLYAKRTGYAEGTVSKAVLSKGTRARELREGHGITAERLEKADEILRKLEEGEGE